MTINSSLINTRKSKQKIEIRIKNILSHTTKKRGKLLQVQKYLELHLEFLRKSMGLANPTLRKGVVREKKKCLKKLSLQL